MSEQDRIAFEAWYDNDISEPLPDDYTILGKRYLYMGWQSATAEANKRMVDSEREIANLKLNIAAQEQLGYELQASNNRLRDGIAEIAVEAQDTYTNAALTKLLSATPAESLQAHDDELLERAEKAADSARWAGTDVVLAIRALKEVTK